MFLLEWGRFEGFIRFPLHVTTTTRGQGKMGYIESWKHLVEEALQSRPASEREVYWEVDESDSAARGFGYTAGTGVEAWKEAEVVQRSNEHIKGRMHHRISSIRGIHDGHRAIRRGTHLRMRCRRVGAKLPTWIRKKGSLRKIGNISNDRGRLPGRKQPHEQGKLCLRWRVLRGYQRAVQRRTFQITKRSNKALRRRARPTIMLIRRCLRSAIPSIAATVGTDILELINLDILNEHLGLNIDLSDAWQRLLGHEAVFENIETFLGECATDPYAMDGLEKRGPFQTQYMEGYSSL
jgi:hypothetical protein